MSFKIPPLAEPRPTHDAPIRLLSCVLLKMVSNIARFKEKHSASFIEAVVSSLESLALRIVGLSDFVHLIRYSFEMLLLYFDSRVHMVFIVPVEVVNIVLPAGIHFGV